MHAHIRGGSTCSGSFFHRRLRLHRRPFSSLLLSLLCLSLSLLLLASLSPPSSSSSSSSSPLQPVSAQWFSDPCQYHPHALQQLRLRFRSIVGQQSATDAIYSHVQAHLERYEQSRRQSRAAHNEPPPFVQPIKPLVLSFHGPTGSGKSLTAYSLSSSLFHKAHSNHVHTYHGSEFSGTSESAVLDSLSFLKREFATHVRRCPLSLFIIEEIHLMAPGVLDGLRHLMDAQPPNTRIKMDEEPRVEVEGGGEQQQEGEDKEEGATGSVTIKGNGGDRNGGGGRSLHNGGWGSTSSRSQSVPINFSHVIWIFTTNIGSEQVQKVAYEAAKEGKSRDSLTPHVLHDMLQGSLARASQLQLLRDSSVLSALVPFFPLFKSHVKECAAVQLGFRRQLWLQQRQLANFTWDSSVTSFAAGQLKYQGPISIYGCKNIHELLTQVLLSPLTRTFRLVEEEERERLEETLRDPHRSILTKAGAYSSHLFRRAKSIVMGEPQWNLGQANVSVRVQRKEDAEGAQQGEEIIFTIEEPRKKRPEGEEDEEEDAADGEEEEGSIHRWEIRHPLHAYAHSTTFHTLTPARAPTKHTHMSGDPTEVGAAAGGAPAAAAHPGTRRFEVPQVHNSHRDEL